MINSVSDHFALQRDLDQVEKWAYTWQMKLAPYKMFCYVSHFEEFFFPV